MYRGRLWTMRQYAGFGTAAESNRRYRYLLEQGVSGLSVAFDLPTQMGYDSDHPLAAGEVGRVGVAIDSIEDMAQLFDGIPLDRVSTSMTINATAIILLALYIAVARRTGRRRRRRSRARCRTTSSRNTSRAAPTSIRRGRRCGSSPTSSRSASASCRNWNTISISGYHIREAGSTAVAGGRLHLRQRDRLRRGGASRPASTSTRFGQRLSFFFNAHNDFLEEVAKFRAARRLWARIMRDRFGATNPRAQQLRFHTQTAGSTLTAQQPDNNIVRVAHAGAGGGARRHAVAALQRPRRGARRCRPRRRRASRSARSRSSRARAAWPTRVDPLGGCLGDRGS